MARAGDEAEVEARLAADCWTVKNSARHASDHTLGLRGLARQPLTLGADGHSHALAMPRR